MSDNNVILKVENLCQYFKMGTFENRAVDGVSFEIKKGEVFGLVGESGCGKTTTGRTIIKLYEATSGNVWLKGQRICAGSRSYKNAISIAQAQAKKQLAEIQEAQKAELEKDISEQEKVSIKLKYKQQADEIKKQLSIVVEENRKLAKKAEVDQKFCDKDFAKKRVKEVDDYYLPLIAQAEGSADTAKLEELKAKHKNERRIAKREKLVTQIQMIFQDPISSLNPRMTVRDLIAEGLIIKGIKDKEYIDRRVYEVMEMVGLMPEHASRYQHEFSGGQRQRIGIARAIIMNPELLIADEPVSALDVSIQAQVITLLNELREKIGLTILFIAHNLSVVKYFSDRIAVMYYGKIMETATKDELFEHPLHPYTKSLLSAVPYPDPLYEQQRKRVIYNPLIAHNYLEDKPQLREVKEGHFVYCNNEEFEAYSKELNSK